VFWQYMESDAWKSVQKEDLRRWWVVKMRSWRMAAAGSVCHWLCHQTVALLTKGMSESKRETFWTQKVKAQTGNNWCLLDCIVSWTFTVRRHEWCHLHMYACLSRADTLPPLLHWAKVHSSAVITKCLICLLFTTSKLQL